MPSPLFIPVAKFDVCRRQYPPQQRPETSTARLHRAIMQGNLNIQQPREDTEEPLYPRMTTTKLCVDWKSQKKEKRNCETVTRVQWPANQTVFNNRSIESSQKWTHAPDWKLGVCWIRTGRNGKGRQHSVTAGHESVSRKPYLLTYLLTPWSRVLLEKLTDLQPVKKFPACYGTRRFITAFTNARHLSLSWASSIQSIPPPSRRSILILSSHLCLGLVSGLFPSGFPTKTLYTPLLSPIRATCPAHLILLDFITRTILGEQYRSLSSSLCRVNLTLFMETECSWPDVFR